MRHTQFAKSLEKRTSISPLFASTQTFLPRIQRHIPMQKIIPKKIRQAIIGALTFSTLTGCVVSVSHDDNAPASDELSIARAVAALAPDAARYSTQTVEWRDETRNRAVPARLYLPTSQVSGAHSLPLVIFSHGIGGSRDGYKYLGRYFAANGYASLHLQHIGSDRGLWFGNPFSLLGRLNSAAAETEAIDRVHDLRFALDRILDSELGATIDRRRIIAAGHSYGANTTMLAAGAVVEQNGQNISLRDERITAAILLSAPPFYGSSDPARILAGIAIPTLHITATGDDIQIPGFYSGVADRIAVYQAIDGERRAPKTLAVFKDGSHSIFTDRAGTGGVEWNPKVKAATRDLTLAFLTSIFDSDTSAMVRWQETNAPMLAKFEQRLAKQ